MYRLRVILILTFFVNQIATSQTSYESTFNEIAKVYANPSGAYFGITTSGGFVAWGQSSASE
ncbi:hypothetical protein N8817_07755 [Flavobacteriaceae bacterium]|nr:hypothetical protein [Flavobacteriaceae bacterium]MDC0386369.1 hypothetical protein [Flavobacteriaceae bacterium]